MARRRESTVAGMPVFPHRQFRRAQEDRSTAFLRATFATSRLARARLWAEIGKCRYLPMKAEPMLQGPCHNGLYDNGHEYQRP